MTLGEDSSYGRIHHKNYHRGGSQSHTEGRALKALPRIYGKTSLSLDSQFGIFRISPLITLRCTNLVLADYLES